MKRLLRFVWLRIRLIWRSAKGLPPYPSPPGTDEVYRTCVLCGRKKRLWEESFIPVFGSVEGDHLWFPTEPRVGVPVHEYMDRYRVICRDHGGEKGMVVLNANDGQEVTVLPYQRRIKVYRALREVVWWVQVTGRFLWWSAKEVVAFVFFPRRYIYWAKQLGGWW